MSDQKITAPPIPFLPNEGITRAEAAKIAGRSTTRVDYYVRHFGIGRRQYGRMMISRAALAMVAENDLAALEAYRAGDRSSPEVVAYYARAGIKLPEASAE